MKLGLCYMVFDGEELLEFAAAAARSQVDHISVTYQTTSYFGNPCDSDIQRLLERLKQDGLVDEVVHFTPNLSLHPKENELNLRNLGVEMSKRAGCSHHISCDVDEFYEAHQIKYAKEQVEDYDFTMVPYLNYYKDPTYLVPNQNLFITFIHPVSNKYSSKAPVPRIEITRRLEKHDNYKIFKAEEVTMHHMSYIRKDIMKKFNNSCNKPYYDMRRFMKDFENHKVGDRVALIPDYLNRRTVLVENRFGIKF